MSLILGAVADDYTGASDLASTLASNGLRVVQTIGVPPDDLALPDVDAVVVALKSRSIDPGEAVSVSLDAEAWLRGRRAGHVLFKVCSTFDSTDRGNIGPVTDALAVRAGCVPLVCPAYPATRRTVYQGHLFVGHERLDESPLKDHPLNPMRDSSLVRAMARQSKRPVGLIPLEIVEQGADAVAARMQALAAEGMGSIVIDAIFDRHLETVGEAALRTPVSTGASGIALGLARALAAGRSGEPPPPPPPPLEGSTLLLAGSCSAATLAQIQAAERHISVLYLDVEGLLAGTARVEDAIDWAWPQLARGPVLIASSRPPAEVQAMQSRHGAEKVSELLERTMAVIAESLLVVGRVARLIVAGGETSGAVVDRLALQAFQLGADIAPGVPLLYTIGTRHHGLRLALKSGNFGGPDFFEKAIAAA